jgi:hypothetical protein
MRSKMTVNITPLHDRILVRRLEEQERAEGGIIIPDTAKEKPHEGEVIAIRIGQDGKGPSYPARREGWRANLVLQIHLSAPLA